MHLFLPTTWLDSASQPVLAIVGLLALALLLLAANFLVDALARLATRLHISAAVVAATVLSMGTTSPEAAVSATAALNNAPGLAMGNAIGSVVCNAGLILGLGCIIRRLTIEPGVVRLQATTLLMISCVYALACYGAWVFNQGVLPQSVGYGLLGMLLMYLLFSAYSAKTPPVGPLLVDNPPVPMLLPHEPPAPTPNPTANPDQTPDLITAEVLPPPTQPKAVEAEDLLPGRPEALAHHPSIWRLLGILAAALFAVLIASHYLVGSARVLAEVHWKIPQVVVAATIVSFGTSTPELVISITSVIRGHTGVLVGNVIGANVMNLLMVTGMAAALAPLALVDPSANHPAILLWLHLPVMLGVVLLLFFLARQAAVTGTFRRRSGIPLLAVFVGYTALQLWLA
jgi:cation:H+ antiporter